MGWDGMGGFVGENMFFTSCKFAKVEMVFFPKNIQQNADDVHSDNIYSDSTYECRFFKS